MRASIRTSLLRILSATALAVAAVGSTDPALAGMRMGGRGGFHGGGFGGFHGGGFGGFHGGGFGGRGFAGRGFHHGFGFRDRRFGFAGFGGWGGYGYYCDPYWWSVNPWLCSTEPIRFVGLVEARGEPNARQIRLKAKGTDRPLRLFALAGRRSRWCCRG
jgi:hypothetical protein